MTGFAHHIGLARVALVGAALVLAALAVAATPAVAGPAGPAFAASATPSAPGRPDRDAGATDRGMRMDRRTRVFEATGYQTLTVAGLVAGAAIVGGLSAGASGAIVGGTAVVMLYLFMR